MLLRLIACFLLVALVGCGGQDPESDAAVPCAVGETARADGSCAPAGVPQDGCADGFSADPAIGCAPILPPEACPDGMMAIPGDASCRAVAQCAGGPFGAGPFGASTEFVDQAYPGSDSDGTMARPWRTIGAAVDHAASGATIAIAAGKYDEDVVLFKQAHLTGRCPSEVEIHGTGVEPRAVWFDQGSDGSSVERLAISGEKGAISVRGERAIVLDRLWIHDAGGILVTHHPDSAQATLSRSLVERMSGGAVAALSADLQIDQSVVRATLAAPDDPPVGVAAARATDSPVVPTLTVRRSVLEGNLVGAYFMCSGGTVDGSVVRDNGAGGGSDAGGIQAQGCSDGTAVQIAVSRSVVANNARTGIYFLDVDGAVDATVVRGTTDPSGGQSASYGLAAVAQQASRQPRLSLSRSLIADNAYAGVAVIGAAATIDRVLVRGTTPSGAYSGQGLSVFGLDGAVNVDVENSRFQQNAGVGIDVFGGAVSLKNVAVADTRATGQDGGFGVGVYAGYLPTLMRPSTLAIDVSEISGSSGFGVEVVNSFAKLSGVHIARTSANAGQQVGDGLAVVSSGVFAAAPRASATISGSRIDGSARAGIANFGADVIELDDTLSCNLVAADGESDFLSGQHQSFSFQDRGGNLCGCGDADASCTPVTSMFSPPAPLAPAAFH